uniref:Uncharacterized protein n=1 Tax=Oryza sativa subsp. japonica TaxID=39947 RepID=Q6Z3S4_ORYSJ|nr:hypothetical protein [Oryza sativa Japonica Group]
MSDCPRGEETDRKRGLAAGDAAAAATEGPSHGSAAGRVSAVPLALIGRVPAMSLALAGRVHAGLLPTRRRTRGPR